MKNNIVSICGDFGNIEDLENISNNPNFVFSNDPNYETIVLLNENGNVINVNSWLECANYVNGGWYNNNLITYDSEKMLTFICIAILSLLIIFKKVRKVAKDKK